ncbi:hypothetical protein R3P38DRAFT_3201507 [Favolaschia claudopus]|uniref:Uncharacterized protein n=1 Tax=Favolaschia claudopus TaxID=2862362 RepID=A0AAW0AXB0_9AGAR
MAGIRLISKLCHDNLSLTKQVICRSFVGIPWFRCAPSLYRLPFHEFTSPLPEPGGTTSCHDWRPPSVVALSHAIRQVEYGDVACVGGKGARFVHLIPSRTAAFMPPAVAAHIWHTEAWKNWIKFRCVHLSLRILHAPPSAFYTQTRHSPSPRRADHRDIHRCPRVSAFSLNTHVPRDPNALSYYHNTPPRRWTPPSPAWRLAMLTRNQGGIQVGRAYSLVLVLGNVVKNDEDRRWGGRVATGRIELVAGGGGSKRRRKSAVDAMDIHFVMLLTNPATRFEGRAARCRDRADADPMAAARTTYSIHGAQPYASAPLTAPFSPATPSGSADGGVPLASVSATLPRHLTAIRLNWHHGGVQNGAPDIGRISLALANLVDPADASLPLRPGEIL